MKKTISVALAAVLCLTGVFAVEGTRPLFVSELRESDSFQLGKEAIAQIRKDYQEGRYDSFLKEMDASYEQVRESEQLIGLAQLRTGSALDLQWIDAVQTLQTERNGELLQVVAGESSLFAQKVRSVATTDEQSNIFLMIHQMQPGTGKNQDENTLIDLDLEYEYKAIHLDAPQINGEEIPDVRVKQYVLKMEQMDKILLAAQSFEDESLKNEVFLFAKNLDTRLAKNWDQRDLRALVIGKIKPLDKIQERTVSVLKDAQEKMSDLSRNF
jgi:hypothetical protein